MTQVVVVSNVTRVVQLEPARPAVVNTGSRGIPGPPGQGIPGPPGGTTLTRVAGADLGGHRVVRSTGSETVGYASNDNLGYGDDTLGVTVGAALLGEDIQIVRSGAVTMAGWNWIPLEAVFLGRDGLMTQTPPDDANGDIFHQILGYAENATTVFVNIGPPTFF